MHWTRAASTILRFGELVCAVIPVGILATFVHYVHIAGASTNGRIIYGLVIACLSSFAAIVLFVPFNFTFWSFPLDFALFICWIVAFGLMANVRPEPLCVFMLGHDAFAFRRGPGIDCDSVSLEIVPPAGM